MTSKMNTISSFDSIENEIQQLKNEKGKFTPNSQEIIVTMDDSELAIIPANEKRERVISTFGLGGCTATVIALANDKGDKAVFLSHFSPFTNKNNLLGELAICKNMDKIKNNNWTKKKLLVFSPDEYEKDENGKWYSKPNEEITNKTANSLKEYLGEGFEINTVAYSRLSTGEKSHSQLDLKYDQETKKVDYTFPAAGMNWRGNVL